MPVPLPSASARLKTRVHLGRYALLGTTATVLGALLAGAPVAAATRPSAADTGKAAWTTPTFVRAIGARGSAGLYAWGTAYNPVSGEIIVSDYLNYQMRRFTSGGTLLGSFYRAASDRRGQPEGIAIDPRDGSIYVSDHSRDNKGYVAKFTASGQFVREYKLTSRYQAWMAMDAQGYLYVSDSQVWNNAGDPPKVRKYLLSDTSSTVSEVATWGEYGSVEGQIKWITGIAVDPATGRVYVADTANKRVTAFNPDGTTHMTIGVGQFAGDLRGVAVNARTRKIYVVDANAGEIEIFDADTGAPLGTFGSLGTGPGQFGDGGRQLTIDASDNVWVADYGNTRLLKFTALGSFIGAYPNPPQDSPKGAMANPRDVAVSPTKAVYAVEQNNHRVQRFNADGSPNQMWGRRSSTPPLGFNYPRGLALQPGNNRIWIANTTQSSVRIVTPTFGKVKDISGFSEPIDIEFGNGKAYVGDANGGYVKILDPATGTVQGQINVRAAGVAVDPESGEIYVTSWYDDRIYHYTADGQQAFPAVIGAPGTGPGQFANPWDIDIVGGLLYVTDSDRACVVVYDRAGNFIGEFGSAGSRAGQFQNPSGLTHDAAGKIYIADAGNDRIQVFDTKGFVKADSVAPSAAITAPKGGQVVTLPLTISGSVSDNLRNGTVELAIQDRATKLWWDGRIATWGTTKQWTNAGIRGGDVKNGTWWFPLIGAGRRGSYAVSVRPVDAAGNLGPIVSSTFATG